MMAEEKHDGAYFALSQGKVKTRSPDGIKSYAESSILKINLLFAYQKLMGHILNIAFIYKATPDVLAKIVRNRVQLHLASKNTPKQWQSPGPKIMP